MKWLRLKVYSIAAMRRDGSGKQGYALVAARSLKVAAGVIGCSLHHMSTYGGETWNLEDRALALSKPGELVWSERI